MSALKKSGCFKRVLLFAVAGFAIAGAIVPAHGNPDSPEIAALRLKAEKGNGVAQFNLGLAYTLGRDVPVDLTEAFIWLSLAAENGTTGKALESVISKLTDEQLADGQRRLTYRRIALSAAPAAPASGATRVGGAVKASTGGFNLNHSTAVTPPAPESAAPKVPAPESQSTPVPAPAAPPPAPAVIPAPVASAGPDLRDPSSHFLQIIGTLRDEKQQLTVQLTQARNELGKTQAELAAVNAELAALKGTVTRLEADAAAAKLTETRLTVEINAARQEMSAAKTSDENVAAVKPKADDQPTHLP